MLSIVIPFYDDFAEAMRLCRSVLHEIEGTIEAECVLVALDPAKADPRKEAARRINTVTCAEFGGLPRGKNAGLSACGGELVLFLSPGLQPAPGAIAALTLALEANPRIGAACGRWVNRAGAVEKGYNFRRFPTFAALVYDVLLINKVIPSNRSTRRYKMHDFDHRTVCEVEHANDVAFIARRNLLIENGGFAECYKIGWFDQLEMCRKLRRQGHSISFQPDAVFITAGNEPVINRLVADHYAAYYRDELRFVRREFGRACEQVFRLVLALGMIVRLSFTALLGVQTRKYFLKKYRSYVSDARIQRMRSSYAAVLRSVLSSEGV